jgi:hypothetical protein
MASPEHLLHEAQYAFQCISFAEIETLNWTGLVGGLFMLPKAVLAMIAFAGFFLFGLLGPFLLVPLVLFVLLTGPFRQMLKQEQKSP